MRHKVHIKVRRKDLPDVEVLATKEKRISSRIARFLFGDYSEVLILKPGRTVDGIEIREIHEEVALHGNN